MQFGNLGSLVVLELKSIFNFVSTFYDFFLIFDHLLLSSTTVMMMKVTFCTFCL